MAYSGFPIHFLDSRQRPVCGVLGKCTDGFYKVRFAKGSIDLTEAMVLRVLQANHEQLLASARVSGLFRYLVTSTSGELSESFIPMKNKVQSRVFGCNFIVGYAAFLTGLPGPLAVMVNVSNEKRINVEGSFCHPDMTNFIRDFASDFSVAAQRHNTKDYIQVPMIAAERGLIAGLVDNYKKLLPPPNNALPHQLFMFGGAQVYQGEGPEHISFRDLRDAPADWREDPKPPRKQARSTCAVVARTTCAVVARTTCASKQAATVDIVARFAPRVDLAPRGLLPGPFAAALQGAWLNTPEEQRYRASTVFGIEERLRTPFGQKLLECLPPETHSSIAEAIYVRTNGCCVTDDMIGSIVSGIVNEAKCDRLAKHLKRAHDAAVKADAELDGLLERAGQFSAMGVVGDQVRLIAASRTGMAGKAARIEARWQAPAEVVPPWREEPARWPSVRPEARAPRKDYAEEKDSEDEVDTEVEEDPDELYS